MIRSSSIVLVALSWVIPMQPVGMEGGHIAPKARFAVRIENVSTPTTLKLSNGTTAPAPTAPVLWIVHSIDDPIFTAGALDRGEGLESLAEDGDPSRLVETLRGRPGVAAVGLVNMPQGSNVPGPILPGSAYGFEFEASPGQRLTIAFMFGQSNDLFYAPEGGGVALFDESGRPLGGSITARLVLWDAGTEVNQEPGLGPDQAPRQSVPNTGASERRPVAPVSDAFTYPSVNEVVRVSVSVETRTTSS